ncbi:MAG TPA: DUF885 domain-containing protein [Acidimicrobiales bacterium]|nr:DUF885 domain-containing protein [Acidimicrobiales bacterium]
MSDPAERLHRLFDDEWAYQMASSPESATVLGHPGHDDRWTDVSPAAVDARLAHARELLDRLASFPDDRLTETDRVSRDLLAADTRLEVEGARFHDEWQAVNQLEGVQQDPALVIEAQPAATPEEQGRIVDRLRRLPELVDATIDNLRLGLAAGITPPRICLRDVPQQVTNQLVADPFDSPLLGPLAGARSAAVDDGIRRAAADAFTRLVVPAYERLHAFLVDTYLPGARSSIACRDLPDGDERYAHLVRRHTTTDLSAAEIHEIGLGEVARIRGAMERVATDAGFGGFDDYAAHLRTAPEQRHTEAEALLEEYRAIGRRIDVRLPELFGRLPRIPYEIVAVPSYAEQSQTAAYYLPPAFDGSRPGQFFANTYDLPSRHRWEMEALTLHEAVPGHHLQIALAQELDDLPAFRRNAWYTAYGEGWGLYAESLGHELGCYTDPASHFGALVAEVWRAVRLVLDTGLHTMGWTRAQAIAYFEDATGRHGDHDIVVEVDRYIVWPGQALGYKLGELKLKELRARATASLGDRFDLRAFHDEVLRHGCLPLGLLEAQVDGWVAARQTG